MEDALSATHEPSPKQAYELSDRFMGCFAVQANDNSVTGVEVSSFVRSLLLFEQCIMATVHLKDVLELLRFTSPASLVELIQSGALQFYYDSSTAAEIGAARHNLNLTGNVSKLRNNEFNFGIIKGHDKEQFSKALSELETFPLLDRSERTALAQAIEATLLPEYGRPIHQAAFKDFYAELRAGDIDVQKKLLSSRMAKLGIKPKGLEFTIEEFVPEDFRVHSNLIQRFGLSEQKARQMTLRVLMDTLSVYIRTHHMREASCLLGMNETEQEPWNLKVDGLISKATTDVFLEQDFIRVLKLHTGSSPAKPFQTIDLERLMKVRASDDLILFRRWLKDSRRKTDKEIQEQFKNIRSLLGNSLQGGLSKTIRFLIGQGFGQLQSPTMQAAGQVWGVADSFLLDRIFGRDPALAIIGKEYPALFR